MAFPEKPLKIPGATLFEGIVPVEKARLPLDLLAGITLAALAIPEVMGYAQIAGMPIVTGLYTLLIPLALFALFGSSRHLVVSADSATAAVLAATLILVATPASPGYVALAAAVALLAGIFLLLARIFQLGFIADFLSRTVLIGFLTGVGIQIALGQLPGVFGVPSEGANVFIQMGNILTETGQMNALTLAISLSTILVILLGSRFARRIPWALLVVIVAIIASYAADLASRGVPVLGPVPGGLPELSFPAVTVADVPFLLGPAAVCFILILAQSAATSRAYANRYQEKVHENTDLVGLGLANIGASLSGTFVVNGSPTKTEMVDSAGGRSQVAHLVTVAVVLLVLAFLTGPLAYLPTVVLADIVFLIGFHLIDVRGMQGILARRPVEFEVALVTTLAVVIFGVGWGIVLAILISVLAHLRHSYRPLNYLLTRGSEGRWVSCPLSSGAQAIDGLVIYRFGADLYYINEGKMAEEVLDIVDSARKPVRWFCFSASSVNDIDYSGAEALKQLHGQLRSRGVTLVLSHLEEHVRDELERDKLMDLIGKDLIFPSKDDVMIAYLRMSEGGESPGGPAV
jgi:high affinity sulfate transporter 1